MCCLKLRCSSMWIPRSLKLDSRDSEEIRSMGEIRAGSSGEPISLQLYTTLQTAGSTGLFGVRKMMYLVLEAFKHILLDLNQLAIFCNSQFTYARTSARTGPLASIAFRGNASCFNLRQWT